MKSTVTLFLSIAIGLSVTSCKTTQSTNNTFGKVKTETLNQTEKVVKDVIFGQWTAINVGEQSIEGDNGPYINFQKVQGNPYLTKFYANNGCNTLNGELAITPGGKMEPTSETASTMMFCADAPYEMGFNLAINTVRSYSIEKIGAEYLLYMKNSNGETTMVLRKPDVDYVNGAWAVVSINGTVLNPDNNVPEITIDLATSKLHGNAGCNVVNGKVSSNTSEQHSLNFSNLITTRMMCPDMDIETQFLQALGSVTKAYSTNNSKGLDLKDAKGKTVLHMVRIEQPDGY